MDGVSAGSAIRSGTFHPFRADTRALSDDADFRISVESAIQGASAHIQADGGTRTASICGGYIALRDAINKLIESGDIQENPIIEPIAAISIGICNDEICLDLDYEEDSHARVDSNVILTKSGKIVDFQTTAEGEPYEKAQMLELFETAQQGIDKIIAMYDEV